MNDPIACIIFDHYLSLYHRLDDIRRVRARLKQPRVDRGGERGDDLLVLMRVLRHANLDNE